MTFELESRGVNTLGLQVAGVKGVVLIAPPADGQ